VSFVKSAIRIVGYVAIPFNLGLAVGLLVVSELVGIFEELVLRYEQNTIHHKKG